MPTSLVRRLLSWGMVAAALLFLGFAIARNLSSLRDFDWSFDPAKLVVSIVAHIAVLAWGVFVWSRVVARFQVGAPSYPALLRVWALSSVARYIPGGGVWQFVAAAQLARNTALSRTLLLTSLMVHMGLTLLAAGLIAVWTLGMVVPGLPPLPAWSMPASLLLLPLVHPAVLDAALGVVNRVAKREVVGWRGSWLDGIWLLALQVVSWIAYGAAFYLFIDALIDVAPAALLPLAGVNALSFAAGYLVLFAPGGLGPRELAMSALLTPFVPVGVAAILAVASRLWSIVAEIGVAGVAILVWSRRAP